MNNNIMRKVAVGQDYQPLTPNDLVASVEISTPPTNSGVVYFLGDDGSDVPWLPGEFHRFQRINLAEIKVRGTDGDIVTVIGGTW